METYQIVYKLTDQNLQTYRGFQYQIGVPAVANGIGELCGPGWLHAYSHPLLALLLNPIHANIQNPRLWRAKAKAPVKDDKGRKLGTSELMVLEELVIPSLTLEQRLTFGILCAKIVFKNTTWEKWADGWLQGVNRTAAAAYAATAAAATAATAAAAAAAYADAAATADAAAYAAAYADTAADAAADAAAYAAAAADAAYFFFPVLNQLVHKWPELQLL